MNCLECRQLILTDPYTRDAKYAAHVLECRQCHQFKEEITGLDASVRQAASVPVPEGLASKILLNHSLQQAPRKSLNWVKYGVAASFFAALVFAATLVTSNLNNQNDQAAPLLTHAAHQAHEFYGSEHKPISNAEVEALLKKFHVEASLENVVYAAICPIKGESAAHLVIKDGEDQYTVMLLPDDAPSKMYAIDDGVWRGFVSPHPAGALAILAEVADRHAAERIATVRDKLQTQIYFSAGT